MATYVVYSNAQYNIYNGLNEYIVDKCDISLKRILNYQVLNKINDLSSVKILYGLVPDVKYNVKHKNVDIFAILTIITDTVVGTSEHPSQLEKITLECENNDTLNDFVVEATQYRINLKNILDATRNHIDIYDYSSYWNLSASQIKRSIDTLYLKDNHTSNIINNITQFMNGKELYESHGIPYKFVHLLEGPPGTGKTSTILAVASYFNLNIGKLSVKSLNFEKAARCIPPDSILLIEDIDATAELSDISKILNVLDGISYKNKLLIFMTTNYYEKLSSVLLRPGRVDQIIHYDYCDKQQIISMLHKLRPSEDAEKFYDKISHMEITPAEFQKFLFFNIGKELNIAQLKEIKEYAEKDNKYKNMFT